MALGPSAPSRWGPTWAEFLRSQAKAILATDFFAVTLLNGATVYALDIIEHASQRVRILGVTAHPDNRWGADPVLVIDPAVAPAAAGRPCADLVAARARRRSLAGSRGLGYLVGVPVARGRCCAGGWGGPDADQ